MQTFTKNKPGDVIVTTANRVMLITGEMEPFLYTAIEFPTGTATAIDAAHIDPSKEVISERAFAIRQQYMNQFYTPSSDPDEAFIEAMLGRREGSHDDLLATLQHEVHHRAGLFRDCEMGTPGGDKVLLNYVAALERHYQAVIKFNVENDDYRNLRHVEEDTQPITPCVFWNGGYCDCESHDWKDQWCSDDLSHIRKGNK